jgi:hypothetical protein
MSKGDIGGTAGSGGRSSDLRGDDSTSLDVGFLLDQNDDLRRRSFEGDSAVCTGCTSFSFPFPLLSEFPKFKNDAGPSDNPRDLRRSGNLRSSRDWPASDIVLPEGRPFREESSELLGE